MNNLQKRRNNRQCSRTVQRWRKEQRRQARRQAAAARLEALPHSALIGDILYYTGFSVEYAAICAGRRLAALLRFVAGSLAGLAALLLRPALQPLAALVQGRVRPPTPRRLLGLALPLAAAAGFAALLRAGLTQRFVLEVRVDGAVVGCVGSEQVFDAAREDVQRRIASAGAAAGWDVWPTYTLTVGGETMTESEIANAILRASSDQLCDATAVYLDGSLRFVTDEGDHLRSYLAQLQTPLLREAGPDSRVSFVHEVRLADGVYLPQSVVGLGEVLADPSLFQLKTVTRQTRTAEIPYDTVTAESADYDFGKTLVVQEGVPGVQEVTEEVTVVDGEITDVTVVDTAVVREPVSEEVVQGTRLKNGMAAELKGVSFIWPVPGYRSVSRWMTGGHLGTDIAAVYGTPIYAAAAGTVTTAGWHNHPYSYGNYVVIDHGNGYTTLYGHMSSYVVSRGDVVEQGQLIGYVGETGYAFGCHCHFEMAYKGQRFDAHALFPGM